MHGAITLLGNSITYNTRRSSRLWPERKAKSHVEAEVPRQCPLRNELTVPTNLVYPATGTK